ncbi:UDP-N-acetylglucosamine 2-epimerase, partial [bacterium]|nr:UDP-N-acetylglucosamine 2-epimerase [bacterium]
MNKTVLMIVGTRADAIKMAPVIEAIRADSDLVPLVVATSQHREMLDQVLNAFGLSVDIDLDIMRHRQTLTDITVRALEGLDRVFAEHEVDLTIVQGDTTTSFVGGLLSFYHGKAVAHVEAGL